MATNQETAAIKARMDRIPSALSPELVERIAANRASGTVNPYRCNDDQVIRRVDRDADNGTLMRPAFMRDTEKSSIYRRTPVMQAKRRFLAFEATTTCRVVVYTCSSSRALRAISVAPSGSTAI